MRAKDRLSIADLANDPVFRQGGAHATSEAFHNVDPRPDGRHRRSGPTVWNIEEKFEHVAAGRAIGLLPASAAAAYAQPGVVSRLITDIPPIQVCLAWLDTRSSDVIADFAASVRSAVGEGRLALSSSR